MTQTATPDTPMPDMPAELSPRRIRRRLLQFCRGRRGGGDRDHAPPRSGDAVGAPRARVAGLDRGRRVTRAAVGALVRRRLPRGVLPADELAAQLPDRDVRTGGQLGALGERGRWVGAGRLGAPQGRDEQRLHWTPHGGLLPAHEPGQCRRGDRVRRAVRGRHPGPQSEPLAHVQLRDRRPGGHDRRAPAAAAARAPGGPPRHRGPGEGWQGGPVHPGFTVARDSRLGDAGAPALARGDRRLAGHDALRRRRPGGVLQGLRLFAALRDPDARLPDRSAGREHPRPRGHRWPGRRTDRSLRALPPAAGRHHRRRAGLHHAISLWVPAILGSVAFVQLRHTLQREDQPAAICMPLAEPIEVKLLHGERPRHAQVAPRWEGPRSALSRRARRNADRAGRRT